MCLCLSHALEICFGLSCCIFSFKWGGLTLRTLTSPLPSDAAARERVRERSGTFMSETRSPSIKKVFEGRDGFWRRSFYSNKRKNVFENDAGRPSFRGLSLLCRSSVIYMMWGRRVRACAVNGLVLCCRKSSNHRGECERACLRGGDGRRDTCTQSSSSCCMKRDGCGLQRWSLC